MPGIASAATAVVIGAVGAARRPFTLYRSQFKPSDQLARPYVMLGVNVYAAETDGEARRLFTSVQQAFVRLRRGQPSRLPRPSRTSRSS